MEPVSMQLYQLESEEARRQEDAVRPGPPHQIAARKSAQVVGMELSEPQLKMAGVAFHYGLGMSWGPGDPDRVGSGGGSERARAG